MNCDRARELASEAVDGMLAPDLAVEFREHLGACPPCRLFFAELKDSLALLGELPTVAVSDRFDEAVWAKLSQRKTRGARTTWRERLLDVDFGAFGRAWRFAPLGAAAALLVALAVTSEPEFRSSRTETAFEDSPGAAGRTLAQLESRSGSDSLTRPVEIAPDAGEEVVGAMPEAIEVYLRSGARDLRLDATDQLRRANYSYPLRRVGEPGLIRVGTSNGYGAVGRPVSDAGTTVISF